jgi:arsenate reductase (glutaredoxin)
MTVTIYHNSRCSKSRETLKLLQARNVEIDVVEYLKNPPDAGQLAHILDLLGFEPRQLMRTGEAAYTENNLGDESLGRDELIEAMVANPILIQRPIVVANGRARIGRPPEAILEIL